MSTDVLYPILIVGGCLLVGLLVHLLTRPKPSRSDIRLPPDAGVEAVAPSAGELGLWHRAHETALLDFFDAHDGEPGRTPEVEGVDDALDSAALDHPAPEMRAELAAMRVAATSALDAAGRGDSDAVGRHREVYAEYRAAWLERLWQFPIDRDRLASVRQREIDC